MTSDIMQFTYTGETTTVSITSWTTDDRQLESHIRFCNHLCPVGLSTSAGITDTLAGVKLVVLLQDTGVKETQSSFCKFMSHAFYKRFQQYNLIVSNYTNFTNQKKPLKTIFKKLKDVSSDILSQNHI
jgi:hypothetical protein